MPSHAAVRAKERFGLDLSRCDLSEIVHAIQNNEGKLLERGLRGGCSAWELEYDGVKMRVIMSADLWFVVTVMPLYAPPKHRKRRQIWRKGQRIWVDT